MPFFVALSTNSDTAQACHEVCAEIREKQAGAIDLVMVYYSPHHLRAVKEIGKQLNQELSPKCLLGCSGETIIANDKEIESSPALAVWVGAWNKSVQLSPFHLYMEKTSEGMSLLGWPDAFVGLDPSQSAILLLADPFTFPIDFFLDSVNSENTGLPIIGGMASGINGVGQCRMLLGDEKLDQGAVGVLLEGAVSIRPVVSQGCRPIGQHMVITKADGNIIHELSGKTPLQQLKDLWNDLSPEDQALMQHGLHVGRVINEYGGDFQSGDFLVRNVMGLESETGSMVITDNVRVGQTLQFHVRDAGSAHEDLLSLLQMDMAAHENKPSAGLLFSCNGRGTRLFSEPNHDAALIQSIVGEIPLAGFFAQGELGPVGGKNFLHGFTASLVLFED